MTNDDERSPMTVRDAVAADAADVREVASAAWRDTYADLLPPPVTEAFIEAAYAADRLERRIANQVFLVAEWDGRIIAFANAAATDGRLEVFAIYALPEMRGTGAGTALLTELRARFPDLPVAATVLEGNRKGEIFYERRGFVPREVVEDELFGHRVRERRWWLGTTSA